MKKVAISFNTKIEDEVTLKELKTYIKEALGCWGGQRHPDDPLF